MRDRLIELIESRTCRNNFCQPSCMNCANVPLQDEEVERLADYLLANGVTIPPCKVGDVVYYISFGKVYEGKCHAITMHNNLQIHLYDYDGDNASYPASKVFRSREEAEKALKGGASDE